MFSVILPAYNAEKTINKTIDSILNNKTIQKIEVIVINDGSIDNTAKSLETYKDDSRVKIINQENKGVSSARNAGLDALDPQSEYTAFVDDSDTVSENYIEEHVNILHRYTDIKFSIAPIMLEKNGVLSPQSLNFRFNGTNEIVDILKYPEAVQYHMGGTVFRSEVFRNQDYRFNESIEFWEDALLINTILLETKQYGLAKNTVYYYDRNNTSSLSQSAWSKKDRYAEHIKNSYMPLVELSKRLYGKVLPYVQFLIARHYLEYMAEYNQEQIIEYRGYADEEFKNLSTILFQDIDDDTIDKLKCPIYCKIYLYKLKGVEMKLAHVRENIKVLIQKYDVKSRNLTFTFSNEAIGIPLNSKVFLGGMEAEITETKKRYILGTESLGDITLNRYKVKVNPLKIILGFNIKIVDGPRIYKAQSNPMFNRIIKKLKHK